MRTRDRPWRMVFTLTLVDSAVAAYCRSCGEQALADEELEGRPGAFPALEHAVDLPFGQHRLVGLARLGPVGELRQPPEVSRELHPLLQSALELLLPHRHVESRLAQRVRERAEGVPVERLR